MGPSGLFLKPSEEAVQPPLHADLLLMEELPLMGLTSSCTVKTDRTTHLELHAENGHCPVKSGFKVTLDTQNRVTRTSSLSCGLWPLHRAGLLEESGGLRVASLGYMTVCLQAHPTCENFEITATTFNPSPGRRNAQHAMPA